jgi:hypothetical protein
VGFIIKDDNSPTNINYLSSPVLQSFQHEILDLKKGKDKLGDNPFDKSYLLTERTIPVEFDNFPTDTIEYFDLSIVKFRSLDFAKSILSRSQDIHSIINLRIRYLSLLC